MAGQLNINKVQLGDSATATQNFVLQTNTDGTAKLARGNAGATTQDILTVDPSGKVAVPQGLASGSLIETGSNPIGYGTGSGGTVTQLTSKSTAVTLNKFTGQITTSNAALAANTSATFILNNSLVTANDNAVVTLQSGDATGGSYVVSVAAVIAGQVYISIRNMTAGSRSEALVINFAIIKGAVS